LNGYHLVQSAADLSTNEAFNLVIFDGTLDDDKQYRVFKPGSWCFVEGGRRKTIAALQRKLSLSNLTIQFEERNPAKKQFKLKSARRLFGLPLPAFKFKKLKGCSIGKITAIVTSA
jgi:hypothetical protein